ncbi:MAG: glutamate 5-kinase [Candidatus Omnitrophica bacterium]|nr:glutamate 5-kinase [Candidatus Omnitrophota bacterium]
MRLKKDYKRIVIKIGASLFYPEKSKFDLKLIYQLAGEIATLVKEKKQTILVSSGAIALGMTVLGLKERPKQLAYLQASAALGQNELMNVYRQVFKDKGINCAQVLLTWDDFSDRRRYLNAKNTLETLLRMNIIPIINENDTVSTDEIKFGDNDRLSALVSSLILADLLIILSDVEGLLDKNKQVIQIVDEITPQIKALACPTDKKVCVGGMVTKLEAARIAVDSGIPCLIANGRSKGIILSAVRNPAEAGTLFIPKQGFLDAKQSWLAFSAKPKGRIFVDEGAKKALLEKKSLLSVGITGIEGGFEAGEVVSVADKKNKEFARGKVGVSSKQLEKVKGTYYPKEVIHRDNLVILRDVL